MPGLRKGPWTKEEDDALRRGVETLGAKSWASIAESFMMSLRSGPQCLHRWQSALMPGLRKGPWTKEEDDAIITGRESGLSKWSDIAKLVPGRTGKQCRERWLIHLDPSVTKEPWTEEEDALLIQLHEELGSKWRIIASRMPGRSETSVMNRWHSAARRRATGEQPPRGREPRKSKRRASRYPTTTPPSSGRSSAADFEEEEEDEYAGADWDEVVGEPDVHPPVFSGAKRPRRGSDTAKDGVSAEHHSPGSALPAAGAADPVAAPEEAGAESESADKSGAKASAVAGGEAAAEADDRCDGPGTGSSVDGRWAVLG